MQKVIPQRLQAGDEIRVVAPSRGIKIIGAESREIARQRFEALGLKVSFGKNTVDENWDSFGSASVDLRLADMMDAFADQNVKAIFTIIGGFNSNMLLPGLDYNLIKKNPKIFCGFSDITALLNGIYAKTGMVTFSGPHYSSFGMKHGFDDTLAAMKQVLMGTGESQLQPSAEWSDDLWFLDQEKREFIKNEGWWQLQDGAASGTLIGGNLGTLVLLNGTEYRPEFKADTILFVEDCFCSSGDDATFLRQLQAVAQQPDFGNVKGLVIGRFQKASGMSQEKLQYIIDNIPQLEGLPVIANVDFGHTTPLLTLPVGGSCEMEPGKIKIKI